MDSRTYCAAIDLGATNVRCAIIDDAKNCLSFSRENISGLKDGEAIACKITSLINSAVEKTGVSPNVIGISTAGPVDIVRGAVVNSPNMSAKEIFLRESLERVFGVPVFMLTDCKAGAYGEYLYDEVIFGEKPAVRTLVYLTMSTGIGAGVLYNEDIFQGANGNAGEVGHFTVDNVYNMQCGCGGHGHWEAYSSGSGMPVFFAEWVKRHGVDECKNSEYANYKTSENILTAARAGDLICKRFVDDVKEINIRGLTNVVCAYNPDLIVLDGPLCRKYADILIGDLREIFKSNEYFKPPKVCLTGLNGSAPLFGACGYAFAKLNRMKKQ